MDLLLKTLSFVSTITAIYWSYVVAKKHNKDKNLWTILTFFFGFIALGILHINIGKKLLGGFLIFISFTYVFIVITLL